MTTLSKQAGVFIQARNEEEQRAFESALITHRPGATHHALTIEVSGPWVTRIRKSQITGTWYLSRLPEHDMRTCTAYREARISLPWVGLLELARIYGE